MKYPPEVKKLREEIKEATRDLKEVLRRKKHAEKNCISKYTMNLIKEAEREATGKQIDLIFKLTELIESRTIKMGDAEKIIKTDTKM